MRKQLKDDVNRAENRQAASKKREGNADSIVAPDSEALKLAEGLTKRQIEAIRRRKLDLKAMKDLGL